MLNTNPHSILILFSLMISVGFFTLMERKILSLSQLRIGPNKVSLFGIFQPILDGLKLFKKVSIINTKILSILFYCVPCAMLTISLMMWTLIPFFSFYNKVFIILFVFFMLSISSYFLLVLGWASYNKFSFLGSMRSIVQTLSFEVNFSLMLLAVFLLKFKFSINFYSKESLMQFIIFFLTYWVLMMIETQRAPMDMSEAESELVSGFNTEFSSVFFTLIFLSEYLNILMFLILAKFLLSSNYLVILMMMFYMLIMRACFPRLRFDILLTLSWLKIMPMLINLITLVFLMKNY